MEQNDTLGYVNFDGEAGQNNEVEFRVPNDKLKITSRGLYVEMQSSKELGAKSYLGRVISGPFFQTDAVSKDSAFARASILEADKVKFRPDYHGVCRAEILGEIYDKKDWSLVGTSTRPFPQTEVRKLDGDAVSKLIGSRGDVYLGEITGYPGVKVGFIHNNKAVIPRNLGIFGTVGSGKTNTCQVIIEELVRFGWSIIVLDVEGEYVEMDKPSREVKEPRMKRSMDRFGVKPTGVNNVKLYHPINCEPKRDDSQEFGIRFANVDPHVFVELLDLDSAAQMERFTMVYYDCLRRYDESKKKDKKTPSDVFAAMDEEAEPEQVGIKLNDIIEEVSRRVDDAHGADRTSYAVLRRKLGRLQRQGIFDTKEHLGDYSSLLKPSQVTVFDMSGSVNSTVNNIIISNLLQKVFDIKNNTEEYKQKPVLIVMEEAHSYISKEKAKSMSETMDVLRQIARRGRKRWLSLCFVSQQPAHLPQEIFELCNTKIVHQTTGSHNLNAIKSSAGGVNESLWNDIPVMGQGRSLIISPQFRHPLMVDIRPCASARGMTD